jgi:hypothetical protein
MGRCVTTPVGVLSSPLRTCTAGEPLDVPSCRATLRTVLNVEVLGTFPLAIAHI